MAGRGKRGGVRVIYYWAQKQDVMLMLLIYGKNQQDDLTSEAESCIEEADSGGVPMNDELFNELVASVREGGAILREEEEAARTFVVEEPDVAAIREEYGLSQAKFAALLGNQRADASKLGTGSRKPSGPGEGAPPRGFQAPEGSSRCGEEGVVGPSAVPACRYEPQLPHSTCNEPFGSRSEPGIRMTRKTHRPPPGEIPEGRARAHPIGHLAHPRKRI